MGNLRRDFPDDAGRPCFRRQVIARSYLTVGEQLAEPRYGSIAVFSRGNDETLGHVAFVVGSTTQDIIVIGGNQSDAVTVEAFPRDRLLGLRWPTKATSGPKSADASIFDLALSHVLEMEGGFTDDPYDPGGPTNLGITLATYAAHKCIKLDSTSANRLRDELRALTKDTAREIYIERYWRPSGSPVMPPALAIMHFDAAVNHGVAGAARMLQQAVGVEIDGEIGPITISAARSLPVRETIARYADIRLERYRSLPHFWRFGRGWTRRVTETRALADTLVAAPLPPLPPAKSKDQTMTSKTTPTEPKWWGNSMTIWGTIITTLSNVLPAIGPLIGIDITGEMIRDLGQGITQAIQAIGGVVGILLTIYGRMRAVQPLVRRDFLVKF